MKVRVTSALVLWMVVLLCLPGASRGALAGPEQRTEQAPVGQGEGVLGVEIAPEACPPAPLDLPEIDEYPNFCVYYSLYDPVTNPLGVTETQAAIVALYVDEFWQRYTADFGFLPPRRFDTKLQVSIAAEGEDSNACGGLSWHDHIRVVSACFIRPGHMREIIGHELFHNIQSNYEPDPIPGLPPEEQFNYYWLSRWIYEGTATTIVDHAFPGTDITPNALEQGVSFEHDIEAYMADPNADFLDPADRAYLSVVWWKYFAEQFGTTPGEPECGVDAFLDLWQNMLHHISVSAVNRTLAQIAPGATFDTAFRQFALANWTKDLNGLPDPSYNYVDDDQANNPKKWGPVAYLTTIPLETGEAPAAWWDHNLERYGVTYFAATPGNSCEVMTASFHRDVQAPTFYHVVTQQGDTLVDHFAGSGVNWHRSFINNGLTRVMAIAGALGNSSRVDVTISCADPDVDVKMPNQQAVAYVLPGTKFLAQVLVTDGTPTGAVVDGLTPGHFAATIGGVDAPVVSGAFIQDQYWLLLDSPGGLEDGTYDLEIALVDPDTGAQVASDTNPQSVVYTAERIDHVLVIDRSGSMAFSDPPRLPAAQAAANLYIDVTRTGDGLAVVSYNEDVDPSAFDMSFVMEPVRAAAKTYVDSLVASGRTSIGDGLQEAVNQRNNAETDNDLCSFVLLSDGMENEPAYWDTVQDAVQATKCPVTTVAFGPESNEALMQEIAEATGGSHFYNDVAVSALAVQGAAPQATAAGTATDMALDLADTYLYASGRADRRARLMRVRDEARRGVTNQHPVVVDPTVSQVLFVLDWPQGFYHPLPSLQKPDGTILTSDTLPPTFYDASSGHVGWRIDAPMPGQWQLLVTMGDSLDVVPYQAVVEGRTSLTLDLLLSDATAVRYTTGQRVPLYAILSNDEALKDANVQAFVTSPGGVETAVRLFDDGEHGDGIASDGLYANVYTRVNEAREVVPGEPGPAPLDEGAYRVLVRAMGPGFEREALGAFSVVEGEDANSNRLPDAYEQEYGITDPDQDPDWDGLNNWDEYQSGTDPTNPDTDGGGEGDGSEVAFAQDPLDPADDRVSAPDFVDVVPGNGTVRVVCEIPDASALALYRATDPAGPWTLRVGTMPDPCVYEDTATNEVIYYYRVVPTAGGHTGGGLRSEAVMPRIDPVPPNALVYVNGGAPSTTDPDVRLTFAPRDALREGTANFDDITDVMLGNDPFLAGAAWQPFAQDVPWTLDAEPDTWARVYARFRDGAGNESSIAVGLIRYEKPRVFLPLIVRR